MTAALPAFLAAQSRSIAVPEDIDGIVIRGNWSADVRLGRPGLTLTSDAVARGAYTLTRSGTTFTLARANDVAGARRFGIHLKLRHLRGVATSGDAQVTIEDRSHRPLFLDIAGSGTADVTGAVPLLRITTSGAVRVDTLGLTATTVRVHAREASRLAVRALSRLTIVALGRSRVTYAGRPQLFARTATGATIQRLPSAP